MYLNHSIGEICERGLYDLKNLKDFMKWSCLIIYTSLLTIDFGLFVSSLKEADFIIRNQKTKGTYKIRRKKSDETRPVSKI